MDNSQIKNTKNIAGIAFILFGLVLILGKFDLIPELPFSIISFHGILMLIGLIVLISTRNRIIGLLLISFGLFFYDTSYWPVFLVIVGGYLIFNKNPQKKKADPGVISGIFVSTQDEDGPGTFEDASIFGGGHKTYSIKNLRKGEVISIFGGSEIDLRGCEIEGNEAVIEIVSIFGGSTLLIPREWNVTTSVVPILGGFSDSRLQGPDLFTSKKKLVVKGIVIFGGGEIKN